MGHTLWNFHVWNSMGWKQKIILKGEVINITIEKYNKQAKKKNMHIVVFITKIVWIIYVPNIHFFNCLAYLIAIYE